MTGRILTFGQAKARRIAVKHELRDLGHSKAFVEQLYQRLVRHDQLRRARAITQALQCYCHDAHVEHVGVVLVDRGHAGPAYVREAKPSTG